MTDQRLAHQLNLLCDELKRHGLRSIDLYTLRQTLTHYAELHPDPQEISR